MIFRQDLEHLLTDLQKRQDAVNKELMGCPTGVLMQAKRNGKTTFFQVTRKNGVRNRKGINKHPEIISHLVRKQYLQTELELLHKNIKALEQALMMFSDTTTENIMRNMPHKYLEISEEYFFQYKNAECKDKAYDWARAPYNRSNYMADKKVHFTSQGLAVRSKSEVIIAEKLYEYNIPFRYEQVMNVGQYTFVPDFTILLHETDYFYWEHCGMTSNEKYMRHHRWKMDMYEVSGIVPWKNLIVTYDNEDGNIDTGIIESEIKNKLI